MKNKEVLAIARFEGQDVKLTDLVVGGSFKITTDIARSSAHHLGLPAVQKDLRCVVKSCLPGKMFKESRQIVLYIEKWGLIVEGGIIPSSQKGWFFICDKPREHKH